MSVAGVLDAPHAPASAGDGWVQRRVAVIWALLLVNVLAFRSGVPTVVPIGKPLGQLITAAALGLALLLALSLNRRMVVRPNALLTVATLLAAAALASSLRFTAGGGAVFRSARLLAFLAVLWLLTPWWGRRDGLLARSHYRSLLAVCGLVLAGVAIAPSLALGAGGSGRLVGVIWPIPAPQVAEYAALIAGASIVLWLVGRLGPGAAAAVTGVALAMIVASRTRTALAGLVVGVACAAFSLLRTSRRARRAVVATALALPVLIAALAPLALEWFGRNQTTAEITGLTGRRAVWQGLLDAPRSEFNRWLGFGLSDKSFGGLSIDSTWLAAYHDQGLVGVAGVAAMFVVVLVAVARAAPGPRRALAAFFAVYCLVASYTEVGLGDASPYLLTMVVAASLVATERTGRPAAPG